MNHLKALFIAATIALTTTLMKITTLIIVIVVIAIIHERKLLEKSYFSFLIPYAVYFRIQQLVFKMENYEKNIIKINLKKEKPNFNLMDWREMLSFIF